MVWPLTNLGRNDSHAYYHEYPPVNLLQRQEQPLVHMPSNLHMDRTGALIPRSISAQLMQNCGASPWNTANSRETTTPNVPFSTAGTYGTPTGMRHHISNAGLSYLPNNTAAALWHTDQFSSLAPFVQLPRQQVHGQNIDDHDIHSPVIWGGNHALAQITNAHARKHQQYVPLESQETLAKTICIHDDVCS